MKNKNKKKKQKAKARLFHCLVLRRCLNHGYPAVEQATVPPVEPSSVPSVETARLLMLIEKWKGMAKRKFEAVDHESDPFGKRFLEHGAICYFNAACELQKILENPNT